MPLCNISLRRGKSDSYRQALMDGLYTALRDALDVPEGDHFMTITEHDPVNFRTGNAFGVDRSEDTIYIQITVFNTRTADQKQALFRRITEILGQSPGVRAEDLFILLADAPLENWSVGLTDEQAAALRAKVLGAV